MENQEIHARSQLTEMITREPTRLPQRIGRLIRDDGAAEDLAQEALVRALRNLGTLRGTEEGLICKWLDRIACNVAFNHARDTGRQPDRVSIEANDHELANALPNPLPEPAEVVDQAEAQHRLADVIHTLPEGLRSVFLLRDVEELSTADTAAALSISEGLVKWRLHEARQRLRKEILAQATADNL